MNKCGKIVFCLFSIYVKTCTDLTILPVVAHNSTCAFKFDDVYDFLDCSP